MTTGHRTHDAALDACEAQMRAGRVDPGCHIMAARCEMCGTWHTRQQRIVLAETTVTWTGLMAGFAPAATDRTTTGTFDQGGPSLDNPKGV